MGLIPPWQPIQVFPKVGQSQGQGHKVTFFGPKRKVLPQEIHTCYMKAPSLLVNQSCQKDNIARRRQPYVNSNNK